MADNLVKRGNNFSARLFIPAEFQGIIGRAEIVRSLKTKDKRQAIVLLRRLQNGTQSIFFMVRTGMVDRGQLTAILMNYIDNELTAFNSCNDKSNYLLPHEDDTLYDTEARKYLTKSDCYGGLSMSDQYRKLADGVRKDFYEKGNKNFIGNYAKSLLDEHAIRFDAGSPDFVKFREDFAYVYILAIEEIASRIKGVKSFDYKDQVKLHVEETNPVTLKEAIDEWFKTKISSGKIVEGKKTTHEQYDVILNSVVLRFYGADYPIRKLNNLELHRFIAAQQLSKKVKNVTIKKRTRLILDVINLASINHGFPPHSYKVDLKDDAANIPPLTTQELNDLFKHIGNRNKTSKWQFWATLVALSTGLRAGEVVNLAFTDVKITTDDIRYLTVRKSKTKAGLRDVPLPDILLDFGFLDFWEERRRTQEPFPFMDYHGSNGEFIQVNRVKFTNWFANLKKKFVEKGSLARLHSLRHNFANALKQGGVIEEMRKDLCGHEHGTGSAHKLYTEAYELDRKKEEINKARWECDFSLLDAWHTQDGR